MVNAHRGELQPATPAAIRRLQRLKGVLPTRVFESVEQFSGLTDPQLQSLLDVREARIAGALAQLNRGEDERAIADALAWFNRAEEELKIGDLLSEANRGELLVRIPVYEDPDGELTSDVRRFGDLALPEPVFRMNYVSTEGTVIIEHRDVSSLNRSRDRVHEDIRKDHNVERPQLLHTKQLNDCIVSLLKAEYNVSAGYRGCLYLPGREQLVPDARMSAFFDLGEYATEFMKGSWLSPTSQRARAARAEVRQQLVKYVPYVRQIGSLTVACLCENELLMEVAREETAEISRVYQVELSALPILERKVSVDPPRPGMPEVWRRLWSPHEFYLEYERSATTREDIRKKLMPYFRVARRGYSCPVIFICETARAAELFREEHQNLQRELTVSSLLITSTYAEVSAGDQFDSCWNCNGTAVRLS